MSVKRRTNFPRDGHRNNWNSPNCEIDENNKDKVALSRHFSEFRGNVNKPPPHEAKQLLLLNNLIPFGYL